MALTHRRTDARVIVTALETQSEPRTFTDNRILTLARGLVDAIDHSTAAHERCVGIEPVVVNLQLMLESLTARVEALDALQQHRADPAPSRSPRDYDPGSADTPVGELPGATLADLIDAACDLLVDVISEDASDEAEAWVPVFNEATRRLRGGTWLEGHAAGMEQGRADGERAAMARIVAAINAAQGEVTQ